jgi:hypothetical protein
MTAMDNRARINNAGYGVEGAFEEPRRLSDRFAEDA